tara:strand:- start:2947 stop:4020 length:1074 start_codon:yes stop_codon:yes gene_type:complete
MPSISVIMTVLNGEKFISKSIDSLFAQSYQNWELIIINDGSTDDTEDIIKTFNSLKIKIITNKSTMGTSYSRNLAISRTKGHYIAILDSDDISLPKRFELQKNYLDNNSNVGLVGCNMAIIDENCEILKEEDEIHSRPFPSEPTYVKWRLLWNNVICHSSVMFRKTIYEKTNGYHQELPFAADYYLWNDFARISEIYQIPEKLVQYRLHSESLTNVETERQKKHEKLIACQYGIESFLNRKISLDTIDVFVNAFYGRQPKNMIEYNIMKSHIIEVYNRFIDINKNENYHQNQVKEEILSAMLLWQFYYYDLTGIWDRGISWEIINKLGNNALSSKRFYQQLFRGTVIEKFYSSLLTK